MPYTKVKKKTFLYSPEQIILIDYNSLNKPGLWYAGLAEFVRHL